MADTTILSSFVNSKCSFSLNLLMLAPRLGTHFSRSENALPMPIETGCNATVRKQQLLSLTELHDKLLLQTWRKLVKKFALCSAIKKEKAAMFRIFANDCMGNWIKMRKLCQTKKKLLTEKYVIIHSTLEDYRDISRSGFNPDYIDNL